MKNYLQSLNSNSENDYPSHHLLRKLFDSFLDIICSIDMEGKFLHVNGACQQLWGYAPEELTGRKYSDFIHPDDLAMTEAAGKKIVEGENVINLENRYRRKDGSIIPMSWSAQWDAKEKLMFCIGRDDSGKKAKDVLHHHYEQKVKQYNLELLDMLGRITDGFFAMDAEWRITYINPQVEKMLGINREDYLARNYWECFPQMIDTAYGNQYKKAMRDKVSVHFEEYFPPFEKWLSVDAYPSSTGISVFFRDTSENKKIEQRRKEFEKKLERQNQLLMNILERMNQGFFLLDRDFHVQYFNRKAEEILGFKREELLGRNITEWYSREALDLYLPFYEKVLKEQQPFHTEHICPQTGKWVDVNFFPTEEGFSVFFKDIDERKKTEDEIKKLSLVAQRTDNMIVMTGSNGKITWVNDAFCKVTGYSFDEALGYKPGDLLQGPESDPETVRYMRDQIRKGESFTVEILNYTKQNRKYWLEIFCQPLFDEQGNLESFFAIQTDVTERKRMQQYLDQEKQKRQQVITAAVIAAQEEERALVGRELHDNVNQVLTSVKLYQELILAGIDNHEELIRRSMNLLQRSIDEIRFLSKRLSAPTLGNIRLTESLTELVETISATNKISITLDMCGIKGLEVAQEVHLALYRILQEHLTNILKHADAQTVEIELKVIDHDIVMKVTDNGKGFDLKQKRKGIGITNMTTRAESVRGKLKINSGLNIGCVLIVQIPMEKKNEETEQETETERKKQ